MKEAKPQEKPKQDECEKCGGRLVYSGLLGRSICEVCHDSQVKVS